MKNYLLDLDISVESTSSVGLYLAIARPKAVVVIPAMVVVEYTALTEQLIQGITSLYQLAHDY